MNKQLKKKYIFMGIFVGVILIGASYAFFTAGMSSETSTTVRADAGTMKITYDGGANITLDGIYPRNEVWATKNITVIGNNTTDAEMYYKLTLVVDSNTFKASDPLQYELVSTNTSTNGEIISAISKTNLIETSIELGSGHFVKANNARHTYQLKIYYPKKTTSQNDNQNATFSAHVEITSAKAPTDPTFAETILANNVVKYPTTKPGIAVSTASEALLASTEDDYGTSYYFRGAVTNNYVEFANKCWRIVRINGDSSVKLVLHNDNTSKATNPCASVNNSDTAAFARYDGTTYESEFNSGFAEGAYVGFMYGDASSDDYTNMYANINKSTILTNLETWYKNNLALYEDKLADTIWCNDKTSELMAVDGTYNYGAILRSTPTLKCPNDNNGGKLSKFTVNDTTNGNGDLTYKIGLLTADEIAFAGYSYNRNNTTTYLQENAMVGSWWTMSPIYYIRGDNGIGSVYSRDGHFYYGSAPSLDGLRPAISLVPSINVTGDGTSENPYIVN